MPVIIKPIQANLTRDTELIARMVLYRLDRILMSKFGLATNKNDHQYVKTEVKIHIGLTLFNL
jgi:hypothetical protein